MRNQGFTYEARTDPGAERMGLARYLARRWRHSTEAAWRARILRGEVEVEGAPADPDAPVPAGRAVVWRRPPWDEPEVPRDWRPLADDGDLLAVHKPSGLPTMPAGGYLEHTLLHLVRQVHPDASPLHRLGRATSGVVLFARDPETRRRLLAAWHDPAAVEKVYRARVAGRPAWDALRLDTAIGPVPHPLLGTVHGARPDGKPSHADARVLARWADEALVEVRLGTGRPHQIRIQLAAAGHPLSGDPLYGPGGTPRPGTRALPGDPGYLLHAGRLTLCLPDGRRRLYEDPPPPGLS